MNLEKRIINHRRNLHRLAEIGFDLPKTREYIISELQKLGYSPKIIGKGSIIASTVGKFNSHILLRADIDAIELNEETELPFASRSGAMHACGHDMHTAMLLGAAEILKDRRMNDGVLFLFQAGEELLQGAKDAIESGFLNEYNVKCAFGMHVLCGISYESGTVIIPKSGVIAPGADNFKISVVGQAAHGSTPHLGRNSITAALSIIAALEHVTSKEFAPSDARVINIGKISGGSAANVVPESTEMLGNFRFYDKTVRNHFIKRAKTICSAIVQAYDCRAEFSLFGECPPLENNAALLSSIKDNLPTEVKILDLDLIDEGNDFKTMGGSEDFAHFASRVPSVFFSLCAGSKADGFIHPLHTSKTNFDENALIDGARFLATLPYVIEKSLR